MSTGGRVGLSVAGDEQPVRETLSTSIASRHRIGNGATIVFGVVPCADGSTAYPRVERLLWV